MKKNKLWGGRFKKKTNPLVEEFTRSIDYDYKIAQYDVLGSILHVQVLKEAGWLTEPEVSQLDKALDKIYVVVKKKDFRPSGENEDIHTYIQNKLQEEVGNLALKLHAARSRNDQVALSTKFYCKMEFLNLTRAIHKLINAILEVGLLNKDVIIPGFTHLQHAQPVYLKDYLAAYADMLKRDDTRVEYIDNNLKLTIGSGALAGTPIGVEQYRKGVQNFLEKQKEFAEAFNVEVTENSLDPVSDRDFVIEIISALSIIAMHLSRLSEDLIIWSTKEFDFVEIDESFCTGSSLMPQKKNPDVLELVRGYTGRLCGNLVSVLTMMKGLPLTYNRDMQLDKEPLFESFEIVFKELELLEGLISSLKVNKDVIKEHLKDESLYATDLVYYLVGKKVPFKEAHNIVGELYRYSIDNKIDIKDLPEPVLKEHSKEFVKDDIIKLFDPKLSVESKISIRRQ